MKTKGLWRGLGLLAAVIGAYFAFLRLFPNEADCVASGRTVDVHLRHCESAGGYVQLREHVMLHSRDALYYVIFFGGAGFFLWRAWRRARRSRAQ